MTAVKGRALPRIWRDDEAFWVFLRTYVAPGLRRIAPAYAYGVDRVPVDGGVVLAANHFSAVDHPVLAVLCPRPICFFAKAELFEHPLVGDVLAWTGAFPVHRGRADRRAIVHAVEIAAAGRVVGVHLEGTRQLTGQPGCFKPGAVAIAMRAGVPVVPCGLDTAGWSPANRRPSTAVFGEPIVLDGLPRTRRGRESALELVRAEVLSCWTEAVRASAAGFPSVLPDGARRTGFVSPAAHDHGPRGPILATSNPPLG